MDPRSSHDSRTTTGTAPAPGVPWDVWDGRRPEPGWGDAPQPVPGATVGADAGSPSVRTPDRAARRPGWGALVGTTATAALVASLATAGLTGAFDDERAATGGVTVAGDGGVTAAERVVTSTTDDPDWANVAAAVQPSVVAIDVRTAAGSGAGSGVVLDAEGRILTNDHVVGEAVEGGLVVTLDDGRMYEATIVGTDPATDLAVIELVDAPTDLVPARFADSDTVVVGDAVAAVGNPLGLSSTVTTGVVSALDRPVTTTDAPAGPGQQGTTVVTNAIQVDAAVNPGNSGGPLFDATGRVIGINSSIASMSTGAGGSSGSIGLGFAIPANLADQVADQLVTDGVAEHAYLGVYMTDTTASVDGTRRAGAGVAEIEPGTPADEADLRSGDVVIAVDGDPVNGAESLTGFVRQHAAGDTVTLTVVRDGQERELTATLATRAD